jgi:hypothetical protein
VAAAAMCARRGSALAAANVGRLRVRRRFRFTAKPGFSGIFASTPIADRRPPTAARSLTSLRRSRERYATSAPQR